MTDLETWGYLGVFVAAATPWVEILIVIPAGVAIGLSALPVGVVAFVGNAVPVLGIVASFDAVHRWGASRRAARGADPPVRSARAKRAGRLLRRYGLPVLAIAGPAVTGIHLATVVALATGASRAAVITWMTASLAVWTVTLTAASAAAAGIVQ